MYNRRHKRLGRRRVNHREIGRVSETTEDGVDYGVDIGVGYDRVIVGNQQPVINRTVQSIEYDIRIQTWP